MNKKPKNPKSIWTKPNGQMGEAVAVKLVGNPKTEKTGFELPLVERTLARTGGLLSALLFLLMGLKPLSAQVIQPQFPEVSPEPPQVCLPSLSLPASLPADCPPVALMEQGSDRVKVNLLPSSSPQLLAHANTSATFIDSTNTGLTWINSTVINPHTNSPWTNHANYVNPHTNFSNGDLIY